MLSPRNLHKEKTRLETFSKWTVEFISGAKLAKTGFFWPDTSLDIVQCYFCDVRLGAWEPYDDEVTEHIRWSRECPLLRRRETNNVPINIRELEELLPPECYDVCGILPGDFSPQSNITWLQHFFDIFWRFFFYFCQKYFIVCVEYF